MLWSIEIVNETDEIYVAQRTDRDLTGIFGTEILHTGEKKMILNNKNMNKR